MDEQHLSMEEIEALEEQSKRHIGFWTKLGGGALTFAILFHVIVIILGAIWIFQIIKIPEKKIDFMPGGGGGGGERGAETKVQTKKRAQITPTSNVKRVFAEGAKSQYSIPDPGDTFGEMATLSSLTGGGMSGGLGGSGTGKGFGSGSGSGMGSGKGMGKLFGLIPETMSKRCSKQDRLQRLKDNGGTAACEEAVTKGLRWLKTNQQTDGSWGPAHPTAMTGLALLAYFGHCETPASEEFGDSCVKGITYLVNLGMKNDGKLGTDLSGQPFCYEHGIATYALAEALTFCKELKFEVPNLVEVTTKAGQFIIDNQNKNGGWAYNYTIEGGHTDTSVVGWQIQALKACSHTGIKFRSMITCINRGLAYVASCQNDSGGFGYVSAKDGEREGYFTLTGVGMLCHQMWGKGKSEINKGAKYVIKNTKFDYNSEFADLYGHYYESQAMMQVGGEDWKKYNAIFRDQLLNNQDTDGSWKVPGGGKPIRAAGSEYVGNAVYRTCLCTLMLEVYYRFLSTGGGGGLKDRSGI
jgi:hypothetical protein